MLDGTNQSKQQNLNLTNFIKLLSDEQKMRLWIKTLLSVQGNLPEIIKSVDKIIELNASSLSFASDIYNSEKTTYAQVERVIDLTERKNKLLNIFLVAKNLFSCISDEDRVFLKRKFVYNWTAEELSQEYSVSIRTIFRRIDKLIEKIYDSTKRRNWSINFINMQVKDETWLYEKFKKFAKDYMNSSPTKDTENEREL